MLWALAHDCVSRLSCSLSGGELPIDYLDIFAAAQATAAAFCVALRVSRALHAENVCSAGRAEGGERAANCGDGVGRGDACQGHGVAGDGCGAGRRLLRVHEACWVDFCA